MRWDAHFLRALISPWSKSRDKGSAQRKMEDLPTPRKKQPCLAWSSVRKEQRQEGMGRRSRPSRRKTGPGNSQEPEKRRSSCCQLFGNSPGTPTSTRSPDLLDGWSARIECRMAPSPSSFCLPLFFPFTVFLVPFLLPTPYSPQLLFVPSRLGNRPPRPPPLRAVAPRASLSVFFATDPRGLSSQSPSALSSSPCGPLFHSVFGPYSPLPYWRLDCFSDSSILPISESQSL